MSRRTPTIQDVAREAGVSPSTVSNVLNRRWKQTSKETRERVLEVAQRMNYQPNALAASLRRKASHTVGVVFPSVVNPFSTAVLRGIQDEARRAGYTVVVGNTDYDGDLEREVLSALRARQVDGLILATNGGVHQTIEAINASGVPIVLFDRGDPALKLDTVLVDNEAAARHAVDYLIGLGHRRIAMVSGQTSGVPTRASRLIGYQKALAAAGIEPREQYEIVAPTSVENGRAAAESLLELAEPPTALFVANTCLAIGVLQVFVERGIRIPEDLSFLMFDDPDWSMATSPAVTAVAQPTYEIGVKAFQLLATRMTGGKPAVPETVVLHTELRVRASCAPPAAG